MIAKGYANNYEQLLRAARNDDLALLECTDVATGKPVMTICMVSRRGKEVEMIPVAKMFDGNPYHEIAPPPVDDVQVEVVRR